MARQENMKPLEIVGGALILVSFILILLPPDFGLNLMVKLGLKSGMDESKNRVQTEAPVKGGVPQLLSSKNFDQY